MNRTRDPMGGARPALGRNCVNSMESFKVLLRSCFGVKPPVASLRIFFCLLRISIRIPGVLSLLLAFKVV